MSLAFIADREDGELYRVTGNIQVTGLDLTHASLAITNFMLNHLQEILRSYGVKDYTPSKLQDSVMETVLVPLRELAQDHGGIFKTPVYTQCDVILNLSESFKQDYTRYTMLFELKLGTWPLPETVYPSVNKGE